MSKKQSFPWVDEVQFALECGESFQQTGKKLIAKVRSIKEGIAQTPSGVGDVAVCATNLAFAIELYLKSLLKLLDLAVPKTHNLSDLYALLPQRVRVLIEDVYDTALPGQARALDNQMGFTLAKGDHKTPSWNDYKKRLTLPEILERSKNLFQSWRYVFEYDQSTKSLYQFHHFDYGFLWVATEAIRAELVVRLGKTET